MINHAALQPLFPHYKAQVQFLVLNQESHLYFCIFISLWEIYSFQLNFDAQSEPQT